MADFNDNLWDALTKRVHIRERRPHAGTLLDPLPLVLRAANKHQATGKAG